MEALFWITTTLFLLNYLVYPAAVIALARMLDDSHEKLIAGSSFRPTVSLIIAAYNEEKVIREKIENSLALDYPRDLMEIIVVSDGSVDRTAEITSSYAKRGVISMHLPERQGKSAAINRAVENAKGEILVLSDANNDFGKDAITMLIRHFLDERVGAVTGAKHVYQEDDREASRGDGLYWKYESAIKTAESRIGSITSGDGEIFALRRSLFSPIDSALINDDAAITFDIVKKNYRILYDNRAKSFEKASLDLADDFATKVRMAAGGFQTIVAEWTFLFPPRSWFALRFLLHKILRWLGPVLLISIYLSSLILADRPIYMAFWLLQSAFYGISLWAWLHRKSGRLSTRLYVPMYFSAMNLALLVGFCRFVSGGQTVQWRKAER